MTVNEFVSKVNMNPNIGLQIVPIVYSDESVKYYWLSLSEVSSRNFASELEAIYDWLTEIEEFTLVEYEAQAESMSEDEDDDEELAF